MDIKLTDPQFGVRFSNVRTLSTDKANAGDFCSNCQILFRDSKKGWKITTSQLFARISLFLLWYTHLSSSDRNNPVGI